jgi:hypothetical protein
MIGFCDPDTLGNLTHVAIENPLYVMALKDALLATVPKSVGLHSIAPPANAPLNDPPFTDRLFEYPLVSATVPPEYAAGSKASIGDGIGAGLPPAPITVLIKVTLLIIVPIANSPYYYIYSDIQDN